MKKDSVPNCRLKHSSAEGLSIALQKGPFQNNGASPWYAILQVGTSASGDSEPQQLKFSFDTGSNFNWVTSTLCGPDGCHHYGDKQFDPERSKTFEWLDTHAQTVDFGPWGEMQVRLASDVLNVPDSRASGLRSKLYLSVSYQGQQFAELDWDGGIGLPSYSYLPLELDEKGCQVRGHHLKQPDPDFHFIEKLIEQGVLSAQTPFVSFNTDPRTEKGQLLFGDLDPSFSDNRHYVFLPWKRYAANKEVDSLYYLWTARLTKMTLGGVTLCEETCSEKDERACEETNVGKQWFCLDTGSSQFKGDPDTMFAAYQHASLTGGDLLLNFSDNDQSSSNAICVPENVYKVKIEAGEFCGEIVPQFQPMQGLDALTLVGSVLLDRVYTIYQYQVMDDGKVVPVGMWLFDKGDNGNYEIIPHAQSQTAAIYNGFNSGVTGRWENEYGSEMLLSAQPSGEVFGSYQSTTGSTGRYYVYGWVSDPIEVATNSAKQGDQLTSGLGDNECSGQKRYAIALSISWRSCGDDQADCSWHWASTYCGQMTSATEMSVINALVATNHFDDVELGTFTDKLAFHKTASFANSDLQRDLVGLFDGSATPDNSVSSPFSGDWFDQANQCLLHVSLVNEEVGIAAVTLYQGTECYLLKGFVDVLSSFDGCHTTRLSITVSGKDRQNQPISLSGYLDKKSDTLNVSLWRASVTQPGSEYLQANAQALFFTRKNSSEE